MKGISIVLVSFCCELIVVFIAIGCGIDGYIEHKQKEGRLANLKLSHTQPKHLLGTVGYTITATLGMGK